MKASTVTYGGRSCVKKKKKVSEPFLETFKRHAIFADGICDQDALPGGRNHRSLDAFVTASAAWATESTSVASCFGSISRGARSGIIRQTQSLARNSFCLMPSAWMVWRAGSTPSPSWGPKVRRAVALPGSSTTYQKPTFPLPSMA